MFEELLRSNAAIVAELASLRADFERERISQAIDADAALIDIAYAAFPERDFMAAQLAALQIRDDPIGTRLALLLHGKSVKALGKALGGAADKRTISGLVLRLVEDGRAGAIWRISKLAGFKPANPQIPCR